VNPRFLVLIQGDPEAAEAAEATFVDEVRNSGFRIVDAGRTADLRRNEAEMAEVTGASAGRIKAIGQRYGAEVVVIGKLQSEAEPSVGKFFTGRAVLSLRTFEADTGEYLGAKTLQVGGGGTAGKMGPSAMVAKSSAAEEVARLGAAASVEQVRSHQQAGERQLVIIVYGAGSAAEARQVQSLLQSMQGVRGVDQTSFAAGKRLELAAEYGGDPQQLGERLDGQRIGGKRLRLTAGEKGRLTLELQ
jgi:hypothetical protein